MEALRPLFWIGSSKDDLTAMPEDVCREIGFALFRAQQGKMHVHAKPLHGFGSAGVLEVVEWDRDGTYRAVYTVRLKHGVYVLHCFQKKSTKGIKTSDQNKALIRARLKIAEEYDNKF